MAKCAAVQKIQKFYRDFLRDEKDAVMLKETLKDFYASYAPYYAFVGPKGKNAERRVALALDTAEKAGRHLELGCAQGHFVLEAARRGVPSVGLDISWLAIQRARANQQTDPPREKVYFCQGDMECLPIRENQFDLVTSFENLEHLVSPFAALAEIVRVLRPGGILILDCAHGYEWVRIRGLGQVVQNLFVLFRFFLSFLKIKHVQRNLPLVHPSLWDSKKDAFRPDYDRVSRYSSKAVFDFLREKGMRVKIFDTFCWKKDAALQQKNRKAFLYYHRLSRWPLLKYFGNAILIVAVKGEGEPEALEPWDNYFLESQADG
ncbi:MAG: class I SAM-dependent methyltransferase [Candidatus Omnitrophota bacterium]